jgi:hypothetical protein
MKIQKVGTHSYYLSIPKIVANKYGIKKNTPVQFLNAYKKDGKVILVYELPKKDGGNRILSLYKTSILKGLYNKDYLYLNIPKEIADKYGIKEGAIANVINVDNVNGRVRIEYAISLSEVKLRKRGNVSKIIDHDNLEYRILIPRWIVVKYNLYEARHKIKHISNDNGKIRIVYEIMKPGSIRHTVRISKQGTKYCLLIPRDIVQKYNIKDKDEYIVMNTYKKGSKIVIEYHIMRTKISKDLNNQ